MTGLEVEAFFNSLNDYFDSVLNRKGMFFWEILVKGFEIFVKFMVNSRQKPDKPENDSKSFEFSGSRKFLI